MCSAAARIRLLLVDDHQLVRLGLHCVLEAAPDMEVVGEAATTEAAVAEAVRLQPQVVLMDLRLPGGGGVQACREILADHPDTRVLFLTSYAEQDCVLAATFAGAAGYLLKAIGSDALVDAIRRVADGAALMDATENAQLTAWMRQIATHTAKLDALSPQEQRVVALLADGKTNKEIAVELELSPKTVRNYLSKAFDKLRISRRAEIVRRFSGHVPRE